jgi:hypothetical protein
MNKLINTALAPTASELRCARNCNRIARAFAVVASLLGGCSAADDVASHEDSLAIAARPEIVILFADSIGIWDGSKAGQVYKLLEGCEYAEWTDGAVNVNALVPVDETPTCPETVTIHGELATGPVLTWANSEDPAVRIWTCSFPAPNVQITGDGP